VGGCRRRRYRRGRCRGRHLAGKIAGAQAEAAKSQARSAWEQAESAQVQSDSAKRQADAAIRQTELQEQIHRDSSQPHLSADFTLDAAQGSLLRLVVRNEGPTVAEDVRIVFDPPIRGTGLARDLSALHEQLSKGCCRCLPAAR
jgi:hypothetical protein